MLFHQGLSLLFDLGGFNGLAAFDPHGSLDSLGDFFIEAGADPHRISPRQTRVGTRRAPHAKGAEARQWFQTCTASFSI
jgi:hypothetical protein